MMKLFGEIISIGSLRRRISIKMATWITLNGTPIYTGWPLFQQLAGAGCRIKLTANDPYPTFMVVRNASHYWLFNQSGGTVDTMAGTYKAYSFSDVKDIRDIWDQ